MEKGNLYKILGIVVLVVGFLGAILLAAVLGTGVYYRNWAVTVSVFLCGAVSSILTAALLWYMGSMVEGMQLLLYRLREEKATAEDTKKTIQLIFEEKLQEHGKWRCPDCGKVHSDSDVFCCGKKRK